MTNKNLHLMTNEGINYAIKKLFNSIINHIALLPTTPEYGYLTTQLYARAAEVLKIGIDKHHKSPVYLKSMLKMKEDMEVQANAKEVKLVKKNYETPINKDFEETNEETSEETSEETEEVMEEVMEEENK